MRRRLTPCGNTPVCTLPLPLLLFRPTARTCTPMHDNTAHTPSRCHVITVLSVLLEVEPRRALQGGLAKLPKKKKAHPTLQALVKIDPAANTNSSTHSGRFGLRRCPRRNGYANEQGRIEHSSDCQGYVFCSVISPRCVSQIRVFVCEGV